MEKLSHTEYHRPSSERRLSDALDYYKLTMGQVALEKFRDTEVTFTFKNRAQEKLGPDFAITGVNWLKIRFNEIREQGFTPEEIAYFAGLQASDGSSRFDEEYLDYLANLKLTDVNVGLNRETNELEISATGPWANVSLWETVVMSEVNEFYYSADDRTRPDKVTERWQEGDSRLSQKIDILKQHPDIKFADFGTRRRYSVAWHEHVVERLAKELPDNFVGTSNPWFAYKYDLRPVGTYAHEMPMVYSALADKRGDNPLDGHNQMMRDWQEHYKGDLSIALTDTFTSEFFFHDFTAEQAKAWAGLRHDSGDPFEFGDRAIEFYKELDIDPKAKTIVFSDGLDIDMILKLADYFNGRVNLLFGWGTSLMNDLGPKANNFVMKATMVDETPTVKLSDNIGKHTGPIETVERYENLAYARSL